MLSHCPLSAVPAELWAVLDLAELWEKGLPPEPGGSMDQPRHLWLMARFCWSERQAHRMKQAGPLGGLLALLAGGL